MEQKATLNTTWAFVKTTSAGCIQVSSRALHPHLICTKTDSHADVQAVMRSWTITGQCQTSATTENHFYQLRAGTEEIKKKGWEALNYTKEGQFPPPKNPRTRGMEAITEWSKSRKKTHTLRMQNQPAGSAGSIEPSYLAGRVSQSPDVCSWMQ